MRAMTGPTRVRTAVACLALLTATSCSGDGGDGAVAVETSPATTQHWVASKPPAAPAADEGSDSPIGVPLVVPSHCGVRSVVIEGALWLAVRPLGGHNPPPGWDENETAGHFVQTSSDLGTFYGEGGQVAHFRRAEAGTRDPNAGCE